MSTQHPSPAEPPRPQLLGLKRAWAIGLLCFGLGVAFTSFYRGSSTPSASPATSRLASPSAAISSPEPLPLDSVASPQNGPQDQKLEQNEEPDVAAQARQMMQQFLEEQMEIPEVTSMGGAQITRREDQTHIFYDVPITGLQKQDLQISVGDGMITVSGKIQNEDLFSSFRKSFSIPEGVEAEKVKIIPQEEKLVIEFPKQSTSR
ncbi:MAG: Hsp20/alpha crystallin family protein [Bdellovibrionales bacterium]|nr:Hsp20/alpha crystallin family protein [Bdellovibrionales bacterium]